MHSKLKKKPLLFYFYLLSFLLEHPVALTTFRRSKLTIYADTKEVFIASQIYFPIAYGW
jgi:hypothetical protein